MATLLQAGPADHGDLRKNRHAAFRLRAAAPLDQKEKAPAAGWRLFFLRECSVWIPGFHWEATPGRGGDNPPQRRQIKTASRKTGCFYLAEAVGFEPTRRCRLPDFESFPAYDFWWKLSEDGSTQRKPKSCGILRILASVFRFYLNPQGFPSSSHFCPEL